jgi:hypothetical protein
MAAFSEIQDPTYSRHSSLFASAAREPTYVTFAVCACSNSVNCCVDTGLLK